MKPSFLSTLPKARKVTPKLDQFGKLPPYWKLKNQMSNNVMHALRSAGWVIEGEINRTNNTTYGLTKGGEHITISDSGKAPYYLGDTIIELRTCNIRKDYPIEMR